MGHNYRLDWMTDDQFECYEMFAETVGGFHHINGKVHEWSPIGIRINCYCHCWATYDFSFLTKAVFLAHDRMIRFEIVPSGPNLVGIVMHKRHQRNGSMYERHPTIEAAYAEHRKRYPMLTSESEVIHG